MHANNFVLISCYVFFFLFLFSFLSDTADGQQSGSCQTLSIVLKVSVNVFHNDIKTICIAL